GGPLPRRTGPQDGGPSNPAQGGGEDRGLVGRRSAPALAIAYRLSATRTAAAAAARIRRDLRRGDAGRSPRLSERPVRRSAWTTRRWSPPHLHGPCRDWRS